MKRSIAPLLLALCLLVLSALPAHAVEIPDLNAQGSVRVQMKSDSAPIPGGSLTLYRVGRIVQTDTGFGFVSTGDFEGYPGTLEDLGKTTAAELAKYAASNGISGEGKTIDETGTAVFDPLEPGLYLLTQPKSGDGYLPADPFLVTLPMAQEGHYVYQVDASPKVTGHYVYQVDASPKVTLHPAPTQPTQPGDPTLPQTGQLNWPIPVLVAAGASCLIAGVILGRKGKDEA